MDLKFSLTDEEVKILELEFTTLEKNTGEEVIFEERVLALIRAPIDIILKRQSEYAQAALVSNVTKLPPEGLIELDNLIRKYSKPVDPKSVEDIIIGRK